LAELVITLAIIVLVLSLAVPLFNVISGARTLEAAQNTIAARISQARTIAINRGQFVGVCFYRDAATDRMASVLVSFNDSTLTDPDTLDKYRGWFPTDTTGTNTTYNRPSNSPAVIRADRVLRAVNDFRGRNPASSWSFFEGKPMVYQFTTIRNSPASMVGNGSWGASLVTNPTPAVPNTAPVPSAVYNNVTGSTIFWTQVADDIGEVDVLAGGEGEQQLLPNGVGLQMVSSLVATSTSSTNRYAQAGLLLFSPNGELVAKPYGIRVGSTLNDLVFRNLPTSVFPATIDRSITSFNRPSSTDLGVVLFDRNAFRNDPNAQGTDTDGQLNDFPSTDTYDGTREVAEETWLDNNGVLLLVNRYSGSLGEAQ